MKFYLEQVVGKNINAGFPTPYRLPAYPKGKPDGECSMPEYVVCPSCLIVRGWAQGDLRRMEAKLAGAAAHMRGRGMCVGYSRQAIHRKVENDESHIRQHGALMFQQC